MAERRREHPLGVDPTNRADQLEPADQVTPLGGRLPKVGDQVHAVEPRVIPLKCRPLGLEVVERRDGGRRPESFRPLSLDRPGELPPAQPAFPSEVERPVFADKLDRQVGRVVGGIRIGPTHARVEFDRPVAIRGSANSGLLARSVPSLMTTLTAILARPDRSGLGLIANLGSLGRSE